MTGRTDGLSSLSPRREDKEPPSVWLRCGAPVPLLCLWGLWPIRVFELDPNLPPALWGGAGEELISSISQQAYGQEASTEGHPLTRGCLLMSLLLSPSYTICLSS